MPRDIVVSRNNAFTHSADVRMHDKKLYIYNIFFIFKAESSKCKLCFVSSSAEYLWARKSWNSRNKRRRRRGYIWHILTCIYICERKEYINITLFLYIHTRDACVFVQKNTCKTRDWSQNMKNHDYHNSTSLSFCRKNLSTLHVIPCWMQSKSKGWRNLWDYLADLEWRKQPLRIIIQYRHKTR